MGKQKPNRAAAAPAPAAPAPVVLETPGAAPVAATVPQETPAPAAGEPGQVQVLALGTLVVNGERVRKGETTFLDAAEAETLAALDRPVVLILTETDGAE